MPFPEEGDLERKALATQKRVEPTAVCMAIHIQQIPEFPRIALRLWFHNIVEELSLFVAVIIAIDNVCEMGIEVSLYLGLIRFPDLPVCIKSESTRGVSLSVHDI